ncbi:MAG: 3-phosphoglycerate dehydrogenase [Gammaproteobacteria bacterium]|nr:3-phosphoglycerate dehydrogenase [Gammaproteobacteria bacterium]
MNDPAPAILVAGRIADAGMEILARAGAAVEVMEAPTPDAIAAAIPRFDALIIRVAPMPAACVASARRLRVVSRHGVGYDNLPMPELTARGIPVAVVGAVNAAPVAEHALWFMLTLARRGIGGHRRVAAGSWRDGYRPGAELDGARLLLMGCGRVGREVAKRAAAFGMQVSGFDPALSASELQSIGIAKAADWRAAIRDADITSLHLPLTDSTRAIIDADALAAFKPGSFLINTARGGLVDETALLDALQRGHLGGAGLDVFADEPPPPDSQLLTAAADENLNLALSPHSAALTAPCLARMAQVAAQNALDALAGNLKPGLTVNPEVLQS